MLGTVMRDSGKPRPSAVGGLQEAEAALAARHPLAAALDVRLAHVAGLGLEHLSVSQVCAKPSLRRSERAQNPGKSALRFHKPQISVEWSGHGIVHRIRAIFPDLRNEAL